MFIAFVIAHTLDTAGYSDEYVLIATKSVTHEHEDIPYAHKTMFPEEYIHTHIYIYTYIYIYI